MIAKMEVRDSYAKFRPQGYIHRWEETIVPIPENGPGSNCAFQHYDHDSGAMVYCGAESVSNIDGFGVCKDHYAYIASLLDAVPEKMTTLLHGCIDDARKSPSQLYANVPAKKRVEIMGETFYVVKLETMKRPRVIHAKTGFSIPTKARAISDAIKEATDMASAKGAESFKRAIARAADSIKSITPVYYSEVAFSLLYPTN